MSLKIIILALALMAVRPQEDGNSQDLTNTENTENPEESEEPTVVGCTNPLEVLDCAEDDFDCCPISWIGDGYADCADQLWGCDLSCYEDNDGGDCDSYDAAVAAAAAQGDGDNVSECQVGHVDDCSEDGDCCPASWIGDGFCDGVDQQWDCDLTCYSLDGVDNDGGDCDPDPVPDVNGECPDGWVADCDEVDCCPASWVGDGVCDGYDQAYGCDLTCLGENGMDGGDCLGMYQDANGQCGEGLVADCSDVDCCPESWLGDGWADCEDQAWGCDLSCHDNDGGDCPVVVVDDQQSTDSTDNLNGGDDQADTTNTNTEVVPTGTEEGVATGGEGSNEGNVGESVEASSVVAGGATDVLGTSQDAEQA